MRLRPSARVTTSIKEDKEARLKAFVTRHLDGLRDTGVPPGTVTYRLLALSADSPVARALAALQPELSAAGVRIEAVLVQRTAPAASPPLEFADCRYAIDARLLDGHEQLVLDPATAWLGDCMRRDPLKRDAYELYCDRCPTTAGNAARSFARLWSAAGPSGSLTADRAPKLPRWPSPFDPSLIAGAEVDPSPVTFRH